MILVRGTVLTFHVFMLLSILHAPYSVIIPFFFFFTNLLLIPPSLIPFPAGSVVQYDPTERVNLMNGHCSPVKTRNVVPHDIGDPG